MGISMKISPAEARSEKFQEIIDSRAPGGGTIPSGGGRGGAGNPEPAIIYNEMNIKSTCQECKQREMKNCKCVDFA